MVSYHELNSDATRQQVFLVDPLNTRVRLLPRFSNAARRDHEREPQRTQTTQEAAIVARRARPVKVESLVDLGHDVIELVLGDAICELRVRKCELEGTREAVHKALTVRAQNNAVRCALRNARVTATEWHFDLDYKLNE